MNNFKKKQFFYEKLPLSAIQQKNIKKIEKDVIFSDKYPHLKKILGSYSRGIVKAFVGFIITYDSLRNTEIDKSIVVDNLVYRYIYIEHLIDFTKIHQNKKRKKERRFNRKGVWSTKLNILCTLGLIYKLDISKIKDSYKIKKSNEKRNEKIEEKGLFESKAKFVRTVNYFAIPIYNDMIFKEAEERAKKLLENGYKQSTFSKTIVIETFGQDFSDKIFLDSREKTDKQIERENLVFSVIRKQVKEKGYTTKDDVLSELYSKINIFKNKPFEVLNDIKQYKYIFLNNLFKSLLFKITKMYEYKPLRKEQKQRLGINVESRKWFIIPRERK